MRYTILFHISQHASLDDETDAKSIIIINIFIWCHYIWTVLFKENLRIDQPKTDLVRKRRLTKMRERQRENALWKLCREP